MLKDPELYETELVELVGSGADEVVIGNPLVPNDVILGLPEERGPVGVEDTLKFPSKDEDTGVIIAVAVSVTFVIIVTVLLLWVEIVVVSVVKIVDNTLEVTIGTLPESEKDVLRLDEDSDVGIAEDKVELPTPGDEVGVAIIVAVSVIFETLVTVLLFCIVDVVRVVVLTVMVVVGLRMLPLSGCPDMLKDPE